MFRYLAKSLLLLGLTVVICCIIYPLVIWGIGQVFFPSQANGCLLYTSPSPRDLSTSRMPSSA